MQYNKEELLELLQKEYFNSNKILLEEIFEKTNYIIDFVFIVSGLIIYNQNKFSTDLKKIIISEILKFASNYTSEYSVKYINVLMSKYL